MNDRLYRSTDDRMFAGVCAGIADRLGMDPSVVRVVYALLALVSGIVPLLIVYVVLAIVVPEEPPGILGSIPFQPPPRVIGDTWQTAQAAERRARREARRAERAGRGSSDAALILGACLVVVGVVLLVAPALRINWDLAWPAAVVALGVLLVVGGMFRRD
jgi:phage shock protein C